MALSWKCLYYFNLAPNYDLTVTPGVLTARGVQLAEDFRYLTASFAWHARRDLSAPTISSCTRIAATCATPTLPTSSTACVSIPTSPTSATATTSRAFAVGTEQTSVTYLERRADVLYYDDVMAHPRAAAKLPTIDISVPDSERPYSRVPRVVASALYPIDNSNFEFVFGQRKPSTSCAGSGPRA